MSDLLTRLRDVECAGKYRNPHGPETADEIERLRARLSERCLCTLADDCSCPVCDGERQRARADRAEARLRAVVEFLASEPIEEWLSVWEFRGEAIQLAGYERCERCDDTGNLKPDCKQIWDDPEISEPCDCINGWRPKGEDDE